MAQRLFGKKRKSQDDRETDGLDWADFVRQGASVTLALVKEAADFAPVPGLKQAAGSTLQILAVIQAVKDNKSAFRLLGDEATALIAVVWRSYQTSPSKETWPPKELASAIEDLVMTLASINEYVRNKLERGTAVRWVYSMADGAKIDEYREKLRNAVHKFEVSSHLTIANALQQLLSGQRQIFAQLAERGIVVERTDTERIIERIKTLKIDDPSPNHPDSASVPRDVTSTQQSDPATRSVHVEVAVSSQEPSNILLDEIVAAAERYKAEEQKILAGKLPGKARDHGTGSNSYRRATVETDEEMDDAETAVEDDWQSVSDSEGSIELDKKSRKRKLPPKAAKKKSLSPKSTLATEADPPNTRGATGNMSTSMEGMHPSMGDMNASMGNMTTSVGNIQSSMPGFQGHPQSPPMFQSPPPNPQFPYPPYNPYFSHLPGFQHYNPSPSQSYTPFPASPPMGPTAGNLNSGYHAPPNMFGYGNYVNSVNSGNISNTNISGVGNDNSVITYAAPTRRKKTRRRDTAGN